MRGRISYLIDTTVEKRVRNYMDKFRLECMNEINDQKRTNRQHIRHYMGHKQQGGTLPPKFKLSNPQALSTN